MNVRLTSVLALAAGFIGGSISHVFTIPTSVQAQSPAPAEIRAQRFVLVDEDGTPRGVFAISADGTPELQVKFRKPKGLGKLLEGEFGAARWLGVEKANLLPELRPAGR